MATMDRAQLDEMLRANPNLRQVETPEPKTFREGIHNRFKNALAEFDRLSALPNDPKTPFETKYQARKILEDLLGDLLIGRVGVQQGGGASDGNSSSSSDRAEFVEQLGAMQAKIEMTLGENYYDTEETGRGFDYLRRGIEWYCPVSGLSANLTDSAKTFEDAEICLLYTSPSPRDRG